jgi:hypothetical protein
VTLFFGHNLTLYTNVHFLIKFFLFFYFFLKFRLKKEGKNGYGVYNVGIVDEYLRPIIFVVGEYLGQIVNQLVPRLSKQNI